MKAAYVIFASIVLSGCASITSDKMQSLSLTTEDAQGQTIAAAKCTLHNDKGSWDAESPGFVSVHRSAEDLQVECKKNGQPVGMLKAISRAAGGMWGNIVFGGGIGAVIDHSTGTGYNYPDKLPVKMGASIIADRKDNNSESKPVATTPSPEVKTTVAKQ